MAVTTLGRQIIKSKLPDKYRSFAQSPLTKARQQTLMTALAKEDPDKYIDILQDMNAIAESVVSTYGKDTTITLDDIDAGAQVRNTRAKLQSIIKTIINRDDLTPQQKQEKIVQLGYKYMPKIKDLGVQDARSRRTGIANQIASGSRGNPVQLMQLIVGDMMMKDAANRDIPYVALMPYADGDSPMSFWASAMSGRKSTYDTQAATGLAGYLSKQATNIIQSAPIAVRDCGTSNTGIPVKASDSQNIGALLLRPWKGYPAGTVVTEKMVDQAEDDQEFIIRSPNTCKAHGGVCALCSGIQENGKLPVIGTYVALNATKSFIQPLTQAGVSCLHQGTKVRMADWSVKAIKDIKVGDMVLGCDKQGKYRPVRVTHVFDNGVQPTYLFKYRSSHSPKHFVCIAATQNHRALHLTRFSNCQQQKFNRTPRVLPMGYKNVNKSLIKTWSPQIPFEGKQEPFALALGLMLGDGCCTYGNKLQTCFSCADPTLIQDIKPYLASLNLQIELCAGQKIYYRISKLQGNRYNGKNALKLKLMEYGIAGKKAHQKQLPQDVFTWSSKSISEFISGLIITDGSFFRKRRGRHFISFASTSFSMVKQVKDLLQMHCGAHIQGIRTNASGDRKLPLYSFTCNKTSQVLKIARFLKLYGVKEHKRLTVLQQNDIRGWHQSVFTCKHLQQRYIGQCHVYDIQVDHPDHMYVLANNTVTHNSKHGSGMGSKNQDPEGPDQPTGLDSVKRMFLAPSNFPGGAVLSPVDGRISGIRKAPQGGSYVTVGQSTVYVPAVRTLKVKQGDLMQAGDTLTNGVPNPMQIVKYKGIGQGRHYFMNKLNQILPKSGAGTARRNLQQFSRAMINKVRITDDQGFAGYYPGDIADYDQLVKDWKPRQGSQTMKTKQTQGKYLQEPALYYSIGTRLTPKVISNLQKHGYPEVTANDQPPPFEPQFISSKAFSMHNKSWIARLNGERLRDAAFAATRRGITDTYDSPSFLDKLIVAPYNPANTKPSGI